MCLCRGVGRDVIGNGQRRADADPPGWPTAALSRRRAANCRVTLSPEPGPSRRGSPRLSEVGAKEQGGQTGKPTVHLTVVVEVEILTHVNRGAVLAIGLVEVTPGFVEGIGVARDLLERPTGRVVHVFIEQRF